MTEDEARTSLAGEPWLATLGRRVLTVPGYLLVAGAYLVLLPAVVLLAFLADLATGATQRPRTRAALVFALYLGCEVVGIVGALALGVVTLGGRLVGAPRYLAQNAALQRFWTNALFFGSIRIFSMRLETEGVEHAAAGPLLLLVRHTSTADTVLTAAAIANPHRILLRYVLKRELLWDPCLDIVGRRLPNAFVTRGNTSVTRGSPGSMPDEKSRDHHGEPSAEIRAVASLARGLDAHSAVLIYPEGTRFSEAKRDRAVARLRERGRPDLAEQATRFRHVLPPKLGGPLALFAAAPDVDVVLVEHTGFEGAATLASFWNGGLVGKTIRVRLRRFAASTIPSDGRDAWLFERWAEMDAWVARETGREAGSTRALV